MEEEEACARLAPDKKSAIVQGDIRGPKMDKYPAWRLTRNLTEDAYGLEVGCG